MGRGKCYLGVVYAVLMVLACSCSRQVSTDVAKAVEATLTALAPTRIATSRPTDTPRTVPKLASGQIAFTSSNKEEICVINIDGTGLTFLTKSTGMDFEPAWSPDGKKIAFASGRLFQNEEIYVMNADGTEQIRLTNHPSSDGDPTWSPDGKKLAFVSRRDSFYVQIYVTHADGTGVTRLTNDLYGPYNVEPAWSPDGSTIAFVHGTQICVMNADGTNIYNLCGAYKSACTAFDPAWAPDGKKLAVASRIDSNHEIYVLNLSEGTEMNLTNNPFSEDYPTWSPDGKKIAFVSNRDGDPAIYMMNADGTGQTRLKSSPTWVTDLAWRP